MRARFDILSFAVLGLLSFAQADTYHYYDEPAKRGILGDILGKLNGNQHGGGKTKTVTHTVKQTITVGAAAAAAVNQTAAVKTITVTANAAAAGNGTAAVKTVTVTATAAAQKAGNGTAANQAGVQLSFVTTTVFGTGAQPTVTMTELASTVTQQVTMTMVQMIACGTTSGSPVPAAQASIIASSAAAAAAAPSVFTSGAGQLASTAVIASGQGAAPAVATTPAAIAQATASVGPPVDGAPLAAPAVAVSTMNPNNLQGVNQGPSIDLSNVSLNSVINLGALIQQPTARPVV